MCAACMREVPEQLYAVINDEGEVLAAGAGASSFLVSVRRDDFVQADLATGRAR